jgi:hypothetical protein
MKVQFSVCAQSIAIDQLTSRLSIFNVLDQINLPTFPVFIPELTFVAIVRREQEQDAEQFKCHLVIMQQGKQAASADSPIAFGGASVARLIFNFSGLAILLPGNIDFNLTLPGGEVHTLTIPVNQILTAQNTTNTDLLQDPHVQS